MRTASFILLLTFIAACNPRPANNSDDTDTAESVLIIPEDSLDQDMPVKSMDTDASNMPVIDPDTSKIEPK